MSTRRTFLGQIAAALAAAQWGTRNLFAQMRASYLMDGPPGVETVINGRRYLYFGGTSYYTLQNHSVLMKAAIEAFNKYGMHAATTRGGFGNTALYDSVERKAAEYFGVEDAAYIVSGYLSNFTGLQAIAATRKIDIIFVDADAHYSIVDFVRVLDLPVVKFAHANPDDLASKLRANLKAGQNPLIMSDGVFPTWGTIAPIPAYLEVTRNYEATLWLDDAHGVGILGPNGRGTYEYHGLKSDRLLFGGTFSKAFGAHGGVIPGSKDFVAAIRAGHVMNGATPSPTPAQAAALAGMEMLMQHPEMRTQLWKNARMIKNGLKQMGFPMDDTPMPVATWALKSGEAMEHVHAELMNRGICIQRSHYVGAEGAGVLRAVVFSTHTPEHINRLLDELKTLV